MLTFHARRYDTCRPVRIECDQGRIQAITPAAEAAGLPLVASGFVDLQVNGYAGREFNHPQLSTAMVEDVCRAMDSCGCTAYLPTLTTDSNEIFLSSLAALAKAVKESPVARSRIAGIHVEGPYISPADGPRGAHPLRHVRPPNCDEFRRWCDVAEGLVKILTISPEYDSAIPLIELAVSLGVIVAIGHTQASSDQIRRATDAGASMSTHLGNGAHPQIKRHPNYIWDQLAEDRLTASLITDGCHLPPSVVKSMLRAKTPSRCVIVSDVTAMGGMPPGRYETGLGAQEVLEDGRLVVAGQRDILAGASFLIHHCVANVPRFTGLSWQTAIELASTQPAALLGNHQHALNPGAAANLVLFDLPTNDRAPLQIRATINHGDLVFGALP